MPRGVDTGLMQLSIDLDRLCSLSEQFRAMLGELLPVMLERVPELDSDLLADVRDELTRLCGSVMWQINMLLFAEERARGVADVRDELRRLCGSVMYQINSLMVAEEKARGVADV